MSGTLSESKSQMVAVSVVVAPVMVWTGVAADWIADNDLVLVGFNGVALGGWQLVLMMLAGVLLLFLTLHLARAIGRGHGLLAKHLLVKTAQYS